MLQITKIGYSNNDELFKITSDDENKCVRYKHGTSKFPFVIVIKADIDEYVEDDK